MKPTFHSAKAWFTFSKGERNGIIVLTLILILIIVASGVVPVINPDRGTLDFISLQKQVDSLFQDTLMKDDTILSPFKGESVLHRKYVRDAKKTLIELNSGDSASLEQLPGIGPVFASRIIKYRNLLGGYYDVLQLKEVYGLNEENLAKAAGNIYVKSGLVKSLSVDTASFRSLARHPYIGRDKAWKIINLRKQVPGTVSAEEILHQAIFDSVQWVRVKPYLFFQKK